MLTIKVGFLISYDYEFIKMSLPQVYPYATEIYCAVDSDGKTWSGTNFKISDEFWEWLNEYDTEKKIVVYRDHFFVEGLSPMDCDTRERNMLAKAMGPSDWYIQIDSDEYFEDFGLFVQKLKSFNASVPTTINCRVITLFKHLPSGYLVIDKSFETLSFATNNPVYNVARNNTIGNQIVDWPDVVLHQSWAREPEEIKLKLKNWSHKDDFNTDSFFNLWSVIDEYNYSCLQNFHPLNSTTWPKLALMAGDLNHILRSGDLARFRGENVQVKRKSLLSRIWRELKS